MLSNWFAYFKNDHAGEMTTQIYWLFFFNLKTTERVSNS